MPQARKSADDRHAWLGALALAGLVAVAVPLAAAGPELTPGAGANAPRWVLGIFEEGLSLSPVAFLVLFYVAGLIWIAAAASAGRIGMRAVAAVVVTLTLLFALAPPLLSLDVFSYISYARLGVEHGLNPYESVPADIAGDPAADLVDDFRFAVSVYGPLFTLGTYPIGIAGVPVALWIFKAVAAVSLLALAWLVARLATVRGVAPQFAVAFVALNPLALVHIAGGAHNDGVMVAIGIAGILAALGGSAARSGVLVISSAAVKATGGLIAPFALLGASDRSARLRWLAGAAAAVLVLGAVTFAAFGSSAAEALGVAGDNQDTVSRYSVPATLGRILGLDVDPIRVVFLAGYAVALVALCVWVVRGADWIRAAGWATFGLLVATAWMVPWYVVWLLPLAAVSRDRLLIAGAVALTLFQTVNAVPV